MVSELLDRELHQAWIVAGRVVRLQRGLVERDDVFQEISLWACTHMDRVTQWREEERVGRAKLNTAFYRAGQKYATRERARITRSDVSDHYFYTQAMIEELLPEVFDRESGWDSPTQSQEIGARVPSRPAEGNNRLALLCDIHAAVQSLPAEDRELLRTRYVDGGRTYQQLADMLSSSVTTVRRRLKSALNHVTDRLGGESPWR